MPFRGVARPEDLVILREALDEYCAVNVIMPSDPERERAAAAIMGHFMAGIATAKGIAEAMSNIPAGITTPKPRRAD